jgi:hypothetical protein
MRNRPLFKMHDSIILVPHWIEEELRRQGVGIQTLINFPEMKRIFSMNDLIGLLALQNFGESVFGAKEIVRGPGGVVCDWLTSAQEMADKEHIEKTLTPLVDDPSQAEELHKRLFRRDESLLSSNLPPYRVLPIEDTHLVVVIQPNAFIPQFFAQNSAALVRDTLKQLYVYEDATLVAGTGLMLKHLTNLSKQP